MFRGEGVGFRVWGVGWERSVGCRVWGVGCRALGLGFRGSGSGFRECGVRYRADIPSCDLSRCRKSGFQICWPRDKNEIPKVGS